MSFESPVSVLYDEMGKQIAVTSGSTIDADQGGVVLMGSGSGGWDYLKFNDDGEVRVAASVDVDLKAEAVEGGTDSITAYGNLAALRQEGESGAERLMVSGVMDLSGSGFDVLVDGVRAVSGAAADTKDAVLLVSSALDDHKLSVSGAVADTKDAVYAVSSAIEALTGGKTLLLGEDDQLFVSQRGALNVSGVIQSVTTDSVEVLASLATRQGATFYFEATAASRYCYLKFGGAALTTDFTVRLTNGGYYELPANYGGSVQVVGNNANAGTLYVSEWADATY
jgi:hypothetical protein